MGEGWDRTSWLFRVLVILCSPREPISSLQFCARRRQLYLISTAELLYYPQDPALSYPSAKKAFLTTPSSVVFCLGVYQPPTPRQIKSQGYIFFLNLRATFRAVTVAGAQETGTQSFVWTGTTPPDCPSLLFLTKSSSMFHSLLPRVPFLFLPVVLGTYLVFIFKRFIHCMCMSAYLHICM